MGEPLRVLDTQINSYDSGILSLRNILIIFISFFITSTDVFVDSIISKFGSCAAIAGQLTTFGTILQGLFMVFLIILMIYILRLV